MPYLVISSSLSPTSRSRRLALAAHARLTSAGHAAEFLDLREAALPMCDGASAYAHPLVQQLSGRIAAAKGVLLGFPIYNYDAGSAAKNLIELTGSAWKGKVVGFMAAAGGKGSFMSPMSLANSLMLDFECLIIPRFVYAEEDRFPESGELDDDLVRRIDRLTTQLVTLSSALA